MIRRHRVGRIVRVLIGHVRRDDGQRARLAAREVGGRVQGEVVLAPATVTAWARRRAAIVNQAPVTFTGSLNVTVRSVHVGDAAARRWPGRSTTRGAGPWTARVRGADDEVGSVVVGVRGAVAQAQGGGVLLVGSVGPAPRSSWRSSIADQVDDVGAGRTRAGQWGGGLDQRDLAGRCCPSRSCPWRPAPGMAGRCPRRPPPGQVVLAGGDRRPRTA